MDSLIETLYGYGFKKQRTNIHTGKPFSMRWGYYGISVSVFLPGPPAQRKPHWVVQEYIGIDVRERGLEYRGSYDLEYRGSYEEIEKHLPNDLREALVFHLDIL